MKKNLQLFLLIFISVPSIYGQGWTTCGTNSGTLSGTLTDLSIDSLSPVHNYITSPSPIGTIPQNEFLIVLHDSLAYDSLGNSIININNDGIFNPSHFMNPVPIWGANNNSGLMIGDTVSVVSFSYDLQQWKYFIQGVMTNSVPIFGPCTGFLEQNNPQELWLNLLGIYDSTHVNTLTDVFGIIRVLSLDAPLDSFQFIQRPMSLRGLNNALININNNIGILNSVGCTNGISEFCYAFDSLATNHDQYLIVPSCINTTNTISESSCDSYTWPLNGNTYNLTGTYVDTLINSGGCDSIVTLDLTIINVSDLTTSVSGITISSNNASATYQWLDCDNNNIVIAGETGQSFTATANGNYAVELTENGCVDTSACVAITTVGILENTFGENLLIYPNPTSSDFSIDLGASFENAQVIITDVSGKLINSKSITQSQILNLSIHEPRGIYIVSVQAGDKKAVIRLIKQ